MAAVTASKNSPRRSELLKSCTRVKVFGSLLVLVCLYSVKLEDSISFQYQEDAVVRSPSPLEHTPLFSLNASDDSSEDGKLYSSLARDSLSADSRPTKRPVLTELYLDRFIVVPEYKLLFCYTEKVGCSMFNHLFRMLRLLHPNLSEDDMKSEAEFQADGNWFRNTPAHHNLTKSDLEGMLMDPTWTKSAFFRDPATRFLSAFRSKCIVKERGRGIDHCVQTFGRSGWFPWMSTSFDHALAQLDLHPGQVFSNPHFAPAQQFCGGIGNTLDYYDFVHQLTTPTAPDHIQRLLSTIGVDSSTAEYLIQNVVKTGGTAVDQDQALLRERYPKGLAFRASTTQKKGHNTGSNKGNVLGDSYGSNKRLQLIYERYGQDYDLFQLPRLTVEELLIAKV